MVMGSAADAEEAETTATHEPEDGEETHQRVVRERLVPCIMYSILQKAVAEVPSASSTNSL